MLEKNNYKTFHYPLTAKFHVHCWDRDVLMSEFNHLWPVGIYSSARSSRQALNTIRYKMSHKLDLPIYELELFPDELLIIERNK